MELAELDIYKHHRVKDMEETDFKDFIICYFFQLESHITDLDLALLSFSVLQNLTFSLLSSGIFFFHT